MLRRRLIAATILAAIIAIVVPLAFAVAPGAFAETTSAAPQPQAQASVVKVDYHRAPRKKIFHRHFRPWAHPTPRQVRRLINAEARRWHIAAAALSNRVACESRYRWWATNGQYVGVLQMGANAFYRGLSTIRSHRFRLVQTHTRTVHDTQTTHYSDGRTETRRMKARRQRVLYIITGRLPRHPSISNAAAQIRIGAQAIRGISAVRSSEWSCAA